MWLILLEKIGSAPRSVCVYRIRIRSTNFFYKLISVRAGISKSKVIYCEKWMRFGKVAEMLPCGLPV